MAELKVKWPLSFLGDWQAGPRRPGLPREDPANLASIPTCYPSASPPGFVIPHPLASLPVSSQHRAGPVVGTVTGNGWHKYSWAGWQGTESTSRWATARACSECAPPRGQSCLCNSPLHHGEGKGWGLCISPTSTIPPHPPQTHPYTLYAKHHFHCINRKTVRKHTHTHTVYSRSSRFVVSVFANSPTAQNLQPRYQCP